MNLRYDGCDKKSFLVFSKLEAHVITFPDKQQNNHKLYKDHFFYMKRELWIFSENWCYLRTKIKDFEHELNINWLIEKSNFWSNSTQEHYIACVTWI